MLGAALTAYGGCGEGALNGQSRFAGSALQEEG
jgi:hypothetical protein